MDIGDILLKISFILCVALYPLLMYMSNNSDKADERDIIKKIKERRNKKCHLQRNVIDVENCTNIIRKVIKYKATQ